MSDFEQALSDLINVHSRESESNTPDYVLAQYLASCLAAFNTAVQQRQAWNGFDASHSVDQLTLNQETR